jgi:hypothetical protein
MKIILSHDVDHLSGQEHWRDVYWPGLWLRSTKAYLQRRMDFAQYLRRSWPLQRLERISEVLEADRSVGGKPTFFFGMRNGLRLAYSHHQVKPYLQFLQKEQVSIGIHGMEFCDLALMRKEFISFQELTGIEPVGIRNHYLRTCDTTLRNMDELGYHFDSTTYEVAAPRKIGSLWEFPITLMDVSLGIDSGLEGMKRQSMAIYEQALAAEIPYFVLNFHDNYFSESYTGLRAWYIWFLGFLSQKHDFINFDEARIILNG